MAPNPWGWCATDDTQEFCVRYHVREQLPGITSGSKDRKCPICGGNLSVNKADIPNQWLLITCHGSGCHRLDIRNALVNDVGIDARCLGLAGFEDRPGRGANPPGPAHSSHADAATLAAARRWWVIDKVPSRFNGQLLHMVIQAAREHEGDFPSDPLALLPTTGTEFYALAGRAGIRRSYKARLFGVWMAYLGRQAA